MIEEVKISRQQLIFLMVAFLLGDFALINPAKSAGKDAWIVFLIGLASAFVLIGIYVYISVMNPGKTLIGILRNCFGKRLGSLVGLLYVWYFLHIASLVLRNTGEYMTTVNYPQTPIVFVNIVFIIMLAYAVKKGLEVIGRSAEIFIPILIILVLTTTSLLIGEFEFKNLLPVFNRDLAFYLKGGYSTLTYPFGEAVVLLMIFPSLNSEEELLKTTYTGLLIVGAILMTIMFREILVLGPDMLERNNFPSHLSSSLIPGLAVEPFISVNLLFSVGGQIVLCMYSAVKGIAEILELDDYKPLVHPIAIITVSISMWVYKDITIMSQVSEEIDPFHVILFQFLFPISILMISLLKKKSKG